MITGYPYSEMLAGRYTVSSRSKLLTVAVRLAARSAVRSMTGFSWDAPPFAAGAPGRRVKSELLPPLFRALWGVAGVV